MTKNYHIKVGQSKPTEGKEPKRRQTNQRPTPSHTWEPCENTQLEAMCAGRGPVADPCKPCVRCFSLCERMWGLHMWIWRVLFSWCPPSPLALRLWLLFYQVPWALMGIWWTHLPEGCVFLGLLFSVSCLPVGLYLCPHQLQEEASLIMVGNSIISMTFILWVYVGLDMPQCDLRGQCTVFFPSTVWGLGLKLKFLGSVANTFTYWAILQALHSNF